MDKETACVCRQFILLKTYHEEIEINFSKNKFFKTFRFRSRGEAQVSDGEADLPGPGLRLGEVGQPVARVAAPKSFPRHECQEVRTIKIS
jgi:hypothetical protein